MLAKHNAERRAKASEILSKHGYGKMKDMVSKGISQHESHDHKGEKKTKLKLATGGAAKGEAPHNRMDRKPRAAGGRNKGHKEPHVSVNVINAGSKPPMAPPGGGMGAPMPPHPPMAPQAPPMAAPPPGMGAKPPMPPQGMPPGGMPPRPFKAGGPVKNNTVDIPHLEGGAGGALGRLEKANHEAKRKKTA